MNRRTAEQRISNVEFVDLTSAVRHSLFDIRYFYLFPAPDSWSLFSSVPVISNTPRSRSNLFLYMTWITSLIT